jgi:predicted ABC-type ATPase
MELILFIGIQGSGKPTFYKHRLFGSHVRLNIDMLRTRHREAILLNACFEAKQPTVIDNTNVTREQRRRYIGPAKDAGFRVVGYFFEVDVERCKRRNARRPADQRIPLPGLLGAYKRMEPPSYDEGFDALYRVRAEPRHRFDLEPWEETEIG